MRPGCLAKGIALGVTMAGVMLLTQTASATETRSYAVSWFTNAAYSQKDDCPGGINPSLSEQYVIDLKDLGTPPAEIEKLIDESLHGANGGKLGGIMRDRGRIDGKPVNSATNPAAVVDPKLHTVVSRYGLGFNLDGREDANSFEDPETHEKGVDNQAFRAMGCIANFRGPPDSPSRPMFFSYIWDTLRPSFPAWLITITADDLSKDGDATITFDRAIEHVDRDVNGDTQADTTFRIDPDPRSHNVLQARIENGSIIVKNNDSAALHLVGDPLLVAQLNLHNVHLRLKMKPDGTLDGILGGYQPWREVFFHLGQGAGNIEGPFSIDLPGVFHALRRMADADPDPKTGTNQSISAAYRIEAVPAFTLSVKPSGQAVVAGAKASAAQIPSGGR